MNLLVPCHFLEKQQPSDIKYNFFLHLNGIQIAEGLSGNVNNKPKEFIK